jgi:hypothetical protein
MDTQFNGDHVDWHAGASDCGAEIPPAVGVASWESSVKIMNPVRQTAAVQSLGLKSYFFDATFPVDRL